MTTVFLSGSMNIKNLDEKVSERIGNIVASRYRVVVGDADGVDTAVQEYLASQGATSVIVYCTGDVPRNNLGKWPTKNVQSSAKPGTREYFTSKDIAMAEDCDFGLMVWDTKSSGTLSNVIELLRRGKISLVYVNKVREFVKIKEVDDLDRLLHHMSAPSLKKADAKLGLQKKVANLKFGQKQLFSVPADTSRIDLLLQYSLLVAGEEDEVIDRQLGPIHLIKYVYLADLTHSRYNKGKTFTGVDWQFYKFGPWSQLVNERIEKALNAIGAHMATFPSDYADRDEWVRWTVRDEALLRDRESKLPTAITIHLRRDVHQFGKNTPDLLDYVYKTEPMLSAAPNEQLDFSLALQPPRSVSAQTEENAEALSEKKRKKFRERMRLVREKQRASKSVAPKLVNPIKLARYDDVYREGLAWLDDLAGERFSESEQVVEFSDEVWKSLARKGDDVS